MEQLPKVVKERLGLAMRNNEHPDSNLLTAFAENSLTKRERTHVLEHLASCEECREVVSLAVPEAVVDSSLPTIARRPVWMSWPMLRWSALAACVIVVGAAIRLHYQERASVVSTKPPESAPVAQPPQPSPYRSNAEKEHAGDKLELQAKRESKDKLELRISPDRERDLDSGRNAPLFDRLEQKNAKIASAPMPPITSDKQISDEVAQLKKDLPAEKIAEIAAGPASDTDTKALSRQRGTRNDESLAYLAKSAESATVRAEAVPAQATEISVSKAKAARKAATSNETSAVGAVAPAGARAANQAVALQTTSLLPAANPRWTISPEGKLQSSIDNGTTWQNVSLPSDSALLALATVGQHVWVGGRSGTLFHSSDSGQHWTQLKPSFDGQDLTGDIVGLEFANVLHGKLITKDQTWLTSDGGQSWRKQ